MKKTLFISLCILTSSLAVSAQEAYSVKDIFRVTQITWFGLDFSNIRLIGPEGFTDPQNIIDTYFDAMNTLVLNEPDKYDLKKIFYKQEVSIDLSVVNERNNLPDPGKMVLEGNAEYSLDVATISKIVKAYKPGEKEGIGLVFIMDNFNKTQDMGYMWVTFFDISTKGVLLTERMSGKASGFGFRNYWANTYYVVMKAIEKTGYNSWKVKYK